MTTEKILEQVKREPRTLIYFGDNIAQFREVAEAVYPEYGICDHHYGTFINATRAKKAVVL